MTLWSWLGCGDFESWSSGILLATAQRSEFSCLSIKTLSSWYPWLADFNVPNKIQFKDYLMDSGADNRGYDTLA